MNKLKKENSVRTGKIEVLKSVDNQEHVEIEGVVFHIDEGVLLKGKFKTTLFGNLVKEFIMLIQRSKSERMLYMKQITKVTIENFFSLG